MTTNVLRLKKYHIFFLSVVSLFAFLAYLNTFNGEFIFDDAVSIEDNPAIKDTAYFKNPGLSGYLANAVNGGRPLTHFTFAVNYLTGGFDPFGYHVINFLVHLANIFLVYVFIHKTLNLASSSYKEHAHWISFVAVIFFGLHPMQTGAVSYISQRAEILASFFYLLGLLFFIRGLSDNSLKSHMAYPAGIVCFLLGLGSKDIIITLPFVLAVYWFYFLRGLPGRKIQLAKISLLVLPVFGAAIYRIQNIANDTSGRIGFKLEFGPYEYFLTQLRAITKYISLLVLPVNQNADYDFAVSRGFLDPPSTLFSFVFLLLLVIASGLLFKRWKIGSFALLWFFIILSPTSSVIPLIDVIFEHRVYLASAGAFLLFSLGLYHASEKLNISRKDKTALTALTVFILALALTYSAASRNMVWTSRISFWEDVVSKSPNKARAYVSLGSAYQEKELMDFAVAAYSKATSLAEKEEKPNSMLALALLYAEMGKNEEALSELKKALASAPINSPDLNYVAGVVYEKAGLTEEAEKSFKEALNKNPGFVIARYALGGLYERRKFYDAAIIEYNKIIKTDPASARAFNELGVIYGKKGEMDEAEEYFRAALKIDPLFSPAVKNLKTVSKLKGNGNEQKRLYTR